MSSQPATLQSGIRLSVPDDEYDLFDEVPSRPPEPLHQAPSPVEEAISLSAEIVDPDVSHRNIGWRHERTRKEHLDDREVAMKLRDELLKTANRLGAKVDTETLRVVRGGATKPQFQKLVQQSCVVRRQLKAAERHKPREKRSKRHS